MYCITWILQAHVRNLDFEGALKKSLELYFVIEPHLDPHPFPQDGMDTLSVLVSLIDSANDLKGAPIDVDGFPEPVQKMLNNIRSHLRTALAAKTVFCFGERSAIAEYEMDVLMDSIDELEVTIEARGTVYRHRKNPAWVAKVNELLEWAGLPPMTEKELNFAMALD
ncbi:hypothetical protein G7Y89_g10731 [Cudoniella acicularis]|uniref:Uncharacterized protein n=1 Tax=Cudoniella acicularis TaxID=354080 RepID=A0A8H4RFV0_9HELO|nr:hypothetical protein G7Y89_g10731 [Cudoniella acicularis]